MSYFIRAIDTLEDYDKGYAVPARDLQDAVRFVLPLLSEVERAAYKEAQPNSDDQRAADVADLEDIFEVAGLRPVRLRKFA